MTKWSSNSTPNNTPEGCVVKPIGCLSLPPRLWRGGKEENGMRKKNYTSSKESLIRYSYIEKLLLLDKEDKEINLRLLNDAVQDIESYLEIDIESIYDFDSCPQELKDACIALFSEKHSMYKDAADYTKGDDMVDVIERKIEKGEIDFDDFFARFSDIPCDIAISLDSFKERFLESKDTELTA